MGPLTHVSGIFMKPDHCTGTDPWVKTLKGRGRDGSAGTQLQCEEATLPQTESGEPGWSTGSC